MSSPSLPYDAHVDYDGHLVADPVAAQHVADLEQAVAAVAALVAKKGTVTKASLAAVLAAVHPKPKEP